jgi:hypothetical protein
VTRRFWSLGGGCYGTSFLERLTRAKDRGRLPGNAAFVVVDRDAGCRAAAWLEARPRGDTRLVVEAWESALARELAALDENATDHVVPSPLAPHLMVELLRRGLAPRVTRLVEPPVLPDTPYARWHPAGAAYLSFAEWTCPVNCIEPATCPATRQPRDWDMSRALLAWLEEPAMRAALAHPAGPFLFRCTHYVDGVGTFPAADVARARRLLAAAAAAAPRGVPVRAVVATVSGCHGAASLLEVEAQR